MQFKLRTPQGIDYKALQFLQVAQNTSLTTNYLAIKEARDIARQYNLTMMALGD